MKGLKRHLRYILLGLALLLVACAGESLTENNVTEGEPIRLTASVDSPPPITRMAADTYSAALPSGAKLDVYIYDNEGNWVPTKQPESATMPWVYVTTGDTDPETGLSNLNLANTSQPVPRYKGEESAHIFAVYPSKGSTGNSSYTMTIGLNQREAIDIQAADLLTTDMFEQPMVGGKSVDLPLKHRMSKIVVKFNPTGNLTASNMPTEFIVMGVNRTVTVNPASGQGTITTSTETSDKTTEAVPLLGCTAEAFIIPPQTISKGTPFLKFNLRGKEADNFHAINGVVFRPSSDFTFESNTAYEIEVNVNVNYITATATITPWSKETLSFEEVTL